jgi:hypothetical protein
MELIKLTKSQKENLQKLLNAFYQGRDIYEQRGSDYYSYNYAVKCSFRYSADEFNKDYKINVKGWKPLREFFILDKRQYSGPHDITGLFHERLLMIEGIGDMIKEAIELKQSIHKAELKKYDEQINLINKMIAKYQLWNQDITTVSWASLNKRNWLHGLFSKEDRSQLEWLNYELAGKKVEVKIK